MLDVMNSDERFYLWWVPWVEECVDLGPSEKFPNVKTVKHDAFNGGKVKDLTAFRPIQFGNSTDHRFAFGNLSLTWLF
jgi:hypothetical protein